MSDMMFKSDTVFQIINKEYLTLTDEQSRENSEHLEKFVGNDFLRLMKEDRVFNDLFQRIVYSGSYYKGTKFGKPDEFDLVFLFKLPIDQTKVKIDTNHGNHGFVKLDFNGMKHPRFYDHSQMLSSWLTDENFLIQDKFRSWFESVFTKAYNKLPNATPNSISVCKHEITHTKSGPAITLISENRAKSTEIHIDLVPGLEFENELKNGYRPINSTKRENSWYVVPKPLDDEPTLWRLCFYEHEKDMLASAGNVKDVIRMMKKLRDTQKMTKICSYYIETIFYHLISEPERNSEFLHASKTAQLMLAVKKLLEAVKTGRLAYFWHPRMNLLARINDATLNNYADRLEKLIYKIEREQNPWFLEDIVLGPNEGEPAIRKF